VDWIGDLNFLDIGKALTPEFFKFNSNLTAKTIVTAWSGGTLPDGKVILEYVVTVVLKQPKDELLAKALDAANVHEMVDVLTLSQPARDALTYPLVDGTEKPLSISHKGMLRTLKIFVNFCQTSGASIDD